MKMFRFVKKVKIKNVKQDHKLLILIAIIPHFTPLVLK